MNARATGIWIFIALPALAGVSLGAVEAPVGVSPGGEFVVSTPSRCPTFSWGSFPDALSYELVVYRLLEVGEDAELVLTRDVPPTAFAWTPSLDECLEAGERYGWSIRATTEEGASEWAAPLLFEADSVTLPGDLEAALEIVRQHLPSRRDPRPAEAHRLREFEGTLEAVTPEATVTMAAVGSPEAKLTVTGEVRTLDPQGQPRRWGKGRQGVSVYTKQGSTAYCVNVFQGVQYGLSNVMVDWGSATDACPVGTWICNDDEVGACDTSRPDDVLDRLLCDGESVDYPADEHYGWIVEEVGSFYGAVEDETGAGSTAGVYTCNTLPVWCCWPGGGIAASADPSTRSGRESPLLP